MSKRIDKSLVLQVWDSGQQDVRVISVAFSCHKDTVMRILVAAGRVASETDKYLPSRKAQTWTRPCSRCRSEKPRPKGLFFCVNCREWLRTQQGGIDDTEFHWPD